VRVRVPPRARSRPGEKADSLILPLCTKGRLLVVEPEPVAEILIQTEDLRREFGETVAVKDVNLVVEQGAVFALVGPNGAGKTTLLKMISGLLAPTSGTVRVSGLDVRSEPRAVQQLLGFLPDFFGLYEDLKVWEYLDYFHRAYRLPADRRATRVDEVLSLVKLSDKREAEVKILSRGMRQRLAIARTLIHDPPLLLLDEPASGLDPESRHHLQLLFSELGRDGRTLLVSSHILSELEDYCSHVAILQQGRLVASGRTEEVRQRMGKGKTIRLSTLGDEEKVEQVLDSLPLVEGFTRDGQEYIFPFRGDEAALAHVLEQLVGAGIAVCFFGEERRTLEETYLMLTKKEEGE